MTERKDLMPNVTSDIFMTANTKINADSDKCLQERIAGFYRGEDYLLDFFRELDTTGNYSGMSFALVIYEMLEIASYKQNMKPLPIITQDIAVLVENEVNSKGEDYFVDNMYQHLKEDNKLIADSFGETLAVKNSLSELIPISKMYRMLEIAEEEETSAKLINGNFEKN
jgi:hypothetical protein